MSYTETTTPVARKAHVCLWCAEKIEKGEKYALERCVNDDYHYRNKYHIDCWMVMGASDDVYLEDWYDESCMWKHKRGTWVRK